MFKQKNNKLILGTVFLAHPVLRNVCHTKTYLIVRKVSWYVTVTSVFSESTNIFIAPVEMRCYIARVNIYSNKE